MFEMMVLILMGKSEAVVKAVEKDMKPYVTSVRVIRKK